MTVLSENDPKTDPIVVQLYGGRGFSSLVGYALETGPYIIDDITQATEFSRNKYAWTKNATVVYLETPAGVGYSNCGDPLECDFNDINAA